MILNHGVSALHGSALDNRDSSIQTSVYGTCLGRSRPDESCGITPRRHLRAKGIIPRDSSRRVGTGDSGPRVTTERFPSPEDLGEREKSLRFVYSWEKVEIPAVMTQCQRISFGALRGITPPPAMALAEISRTSDLQEGSDSEPHYLDRVPDFTGPWTAHLDFPTPTCPD